MSYSSKGDYSVPNPNSAEVARYRACSYNAENEKHKLERTLELITEYSKSGFYTASVIGLSKQDVEALRSLGYRVHRSWLTDFFDISWR